MVLSNLQHCLQKAERRPPAPGHQQLACRRLSHLTAQRRAQDGQAEPEPLSLVRTEKVTTNHKVVAAHGRDE